MEKGIDWTSVINELKESGERLRKSSNTAPTHVTQTAHLAASLVLEQLAKVIETTLK
jgi:hypothetical protein